ncbi:Trm112 family protein [Candidatus Woesearchaeota archaeon]|nr:Trm112 family protein [Candidatus Woesearchaeota archaeon]
MRKKEQKSGEEPIPKELFDILACPLCKADLEYTNDGKGLVCSGCGEKYPINDGIPVLMPKK